MREKMLVAKQYPELENFRASFWNSRYTNEGHIWGDKPSKTAMMLSEALSSDSKILEVGFGYGRDLVELVKCGHQLTGVEEALGGFNEALIQLDKSSKRNQAGLYLGEYTTASFRKNAFDALLSHRMIHLLGNNGLDQAFAAKAYENLKPGGLLFVSARDERDFNKDSMTRCQDGLVEYCSPSGVKNYISLWSEARFRNVFSRDKFEILGFVQDEEPETILVQERVTKFTVMVARKRNNIQDILNVTMLKEYSKNN